LKTNLVRKENELKLTAVCALVAAFVLAGSALLRAKEPVAQPVDVGSFSVLVNGQKVASESFSVEQSSSGSVATSQLREEGNGDKANQTSKMQLTASGELVRYEWRESTPGKTQLEVVPNEQFLVERVTSNPGEKPAEQPFLLPASTVILDNNFFIHRELLAWRYLAQNCKQESGKMQCLAGPTSFGTIVPQDRTSMRVTLEPVGNEKIQVRGAERELPRFNLKFEGGEWALWLDANDHYKLVKIAIPAEKTEVVRD
jgi:hypothetical protein